MLSITFSSVDGKRRRMKENKKKKESKKLPRKMLNMELFISQNIFGGWGSLLNAAWRPSDWRQHFARARFLLILPSNPNAKIFSHSFMLFTIDSFITFF